MPQRLADLARRLPQRDSLGEMELDGTDSGWWIPRAGEESHSVSSHASGLRHISWTKGMGEPQLPSSIGTWGRRLLLIGCGGRHQPWACGYLAYLGGGSPAMGWTGKELTAVEASRREMHGKRKEETERTVLCVTSGRWVIFRSKSR